MSVYHHAGVFRQRPPLLQTYAKRPLFTPPDQLFAVIIAGVDRTTTIDTAAQRLRIESVLTGQPNRAFFSIRDFDPITAQTVIIQSGWRRFAGNIQRALQKSVRGNARKRYDLECIDWTWLVNRRRVTKTYAAGTAADVIIRDLFTSFSSGFTLDAVQSGAPTITADLQFRGAFLAQAAQQVADLVNWTIDVDVDRVVHFSATASATPSTQSYNSAQAATVFVVPAGTFQLIVKLWGGAGGADGGDGSQPGGAGGFAQATIAVTPGETLLIYVGGGGARDANSWQGGGGGGYTAVLRGSTVLVLAPGGGGGARDSAGGPGGGTTGTDAASGPSGPGEGGKGGTQSAGGVAGTNSGGADVAATSGASLAGGTGGGWTTGTGDAGAAGGLNGGGAGGPKGAAGTKRTGGGGGAGYFGGGGGGADAASGDDCGGGGGSGYVSGSATTLISGSGTTPPNTSDPNYISAGANSALASSSGPGNPGLLVLTYTAGQESIPQPQPLTATNYTYDALEYAQDISQVFTRVCAVGDGASTTAPVAAAATSIPVDECAKYSASGGTVVARGQLITYTGRSAASGAGNLTGVPASGVGSIATALLQGDVCSLYIQANDASAQAALAAYEGPDGIHEDWIEDSTWDLATATAKANARLAAQKNTDLRGRFLSYDDRTRVGAAVPIVIPARGISTVVTLQQVTATHIAMNKWQYTAQFAVVWGDLIDLMLSVVRSSARP